MSAPARLGGRFFAQVRQGLAVYSCIPRSVGLIACAAPGRAVALVLLYLVFRLIEPASVWFSKLLVDSLLAQRPTTALLVAGLYVGLHVLGTAGSWTFEVLYAGFRDRFLFHLHTLLMRKATSLPDLALFETPAFYDTLQNARQAVDNPATGAQRLINAAVTGVAVVAVFLTLLGTLALLHPLAAAVVFATAVPSYYASLRFGHGQWQVYRGQAPHVRRLTYYFQLLTTDGAAKEIRIFGLGDFFLELYRQSYRRVVGEIEAYRRGQAPAMVGLPAIGSLGAGAVLLYTVWQATQGNIGVGDLVLYTGAVFMVQGAVRSILENAGTIYTAQLHTSNILEFLDLETTMPASSGGRRFPRPWRQGLQLREVTFRYPGTERPVLHEVSFTIQPGETLALVGPNGAGKTTLVKLLCRLYDPSDGQLLLDGYDLRDYDLADLRRNMTVVFQDYARYALTAGQNIGLADVERMNDRGTLAEAAKKAGADEVIATLPDGYATPLGRQFEGGQELSIGQWQKLALARAFFRDAPLQILDEPTSALDAQAEYDVYLRFQELRQGRTTFLISHRFSTVRMADRIVVLDGGRVMEMGSHDALTRRGGVYADLYETQAARYR
ncbi:MAG: ABC transporter ATP-binding protein [Chloroflexota bacterium]